MRSGETGTWTMMRTGKAKEIDAERTDTRALICFLAGGGWLHSRVFCQELYQAFVMRYW